MLIDNVFYWLIPQHDSYISLVLGTFPTIGTPLLPCAVFLSILLVM